MRFPVPLPRDTIWRLPGSRPPRRLSVLRHGSTVRGPSGLPSGVLQFSNTSENEAIFLAEISHVTVEDHYCNIHYLNSERSMNKLVRLPIKEMVKKLPADYFIQIHRSHIVNVGHVTSIKKIGRDYKLTLKDIDRELPISRSRSKYIFQTLNAFKLNTQ